MGKLMSWTMLFIITSFGYVTCIDGIHPTSSECLPAQNSSMDTIYKSNRRTLLDSLAKNVPLQNGFFNTSVGNGSDRVYGLAWCRADVSPKTCGKCLNDTITASLTSCPESKSLVTYLSLCSLGFSNDSFFGELWDSSSSSSNGGDNFDDPLVFSKGFSMMQSLIGNVSSQPLMFEMGVVDVGSDGKRYGLGQCRRDISKLDCEKCLEDLLTTYNKFVLNQTWWDMRAMSCGLWYDHVRFYQDDFRENRDDSEVSNPIPSGGEKWYKGDMTLVFVAFLVLHWI
ncbi:putative Gnk2-like domain-containing protein [Helianthus annuus]|uniref:Gnk2-like domain-containing protein n=2 Tax=Helianthus annuus TaxID=4232 RepID=A0A251VIR9_HELAN|nr:putative Gnk2-like domain-containing protein [Helianthus annuus]KAJ0451521.1 putative Gnk2-like domain-containing protein [Helianthus annuus]KAJ0456060.1 putative Gnk2-like domain-containing protein [Helianthus annuus]KAJ0473399.1 putative Gnk2-like domain-containing protein [Helianthus annuus]KAJ0652785.1 putative Gnk2-like domain-containing protein [Helianthus annuus]